MDMEKEIQKIEIGIQTIEIDKMFGPTVFASLRITPDLERGWLIERQWIKDGKWIEWCVIPAQIDEEFDDDNQ